MKNLKLIAFLLVAVLFATALTGCVKVNDSESTGDSDKPTVTVTTSFLADMVRQLVGEDSVNLNMIIPAGEDPHLYLAKPEDFKKLQEADLVLYHGLFFEGKMIDILEETGKAVTKDFPEEKLGQMESDGHVTIDPHFWFDLELYALAVDNAAEYLAELLPDKADEIRDNAASYKAELHELDNWARDRVAEIPAASRYLVTPHDAFNYFSRRYDIPVFAPQGVSTDSEVATQDILATVNLIIEHDIKAIFVESTTDPSRMEKLRESCAAKGYDVTVVGGEGQELFSDSLAPVGRDGDTFIEMFKHNVNLIVDHLK